MVEITQNNLINLLGSFLFLAVAVLFVYQTRRKHRNTPLLTFGFFLAFFGQFFNTLTIILTNNGYIGILNSVVLQIIFVSALNLIIFFFWLFLERTNAPSVNRLFLVIVTFLGSAYTISRIFLIVMIDNPEINTLELILWGTAIFAILINLLAFRSLYIQNKIYSATGGEKFAAYQLFGLALIAIWGLQAFVNTIFEISEFYFGTFLLPEILSDIGDVLYFIGLGLFIFVIIVNPDYVHRMPLNIQDIVIIANAGFAVYGIGKNAQEKSLDEQLLAGFLTAANSFVSEMQPKFDNEKLRILRSTDRILRMQFGETIGVCIVSNRENYFLIQSINNLVGFIEGKNPEEYINTGSFYEDNVVRGWLKQFFPFLAIDDMQTY